MPCDLATIVQEMVEERNGSLFCLANLYLNLMIASCSIGNSALLLACLYLTCTIGGANDDGILAW